MSHATGKACPLDPRAPVGDSPALALEAGFDKCVRRKRRSTGMLLIECRLGLWSVEGPDHAFVEQNARHYWIQYHADGEYAQLLSNKATQPRSP